MLTMAAMTMTTTTMTTMTTTTTTTVIVIPSWLKTETETMKKTELRGGGWVGG